MRVMNDLNELVHRFLEAGVVAMNEEQNLVAWSVQDPRVELRLRLREIYAIGAQSDEVALGVAGRRRRPLNFAGLARGIRRNGHDDIGKPEPIAASAAEHDSGRLEDGRARRCDEHVDLARPRYGLSDDEVA